ncbi:unnamed protein product [Bursaphelenchus xylophilus]|uniref:(pine wood nematode) hypothetical protein n=1 Tax=Bursaphelenchus xylophilus TaxID=6326 RepID=A0A1I7RK31_BURXY|nr:unnamed protein product [Bursaphelenchus xylophilus]CAG9131545.1 unnamed protein product [Bursaphelenchus xylophilus]
MASQFVSITKDFVEMALKQYEEEEDAAAQKKMNDLWKESGLLLKTWWMMVNIAVAFTRDSSMHKKIGDDFFEGSEGSRIRTHRTATFQEIRDAFAENLQEEFVQQHEQAKDLFEDGSVQT